VRLFVRAGIINFVTFSTEQAARTGHN